VFGLVEAEPQSVRRVRLFTGDFKPLDWPHSLCNCDATIVKTFHTCEETPDYTVENKFFDG
jgi:hypothetical protein